MFELYKAMVPSAVKTPPQVCHEKLFKIQPIKLKLTFVFSSSLKFTSPGNIFVNPLCTFSSAITSFL